MNRYKSYGKGWHYESYRHSLAAKGIGTRLSFYRIAKIEPIRETISGMSSDDLARALESESLSEYRKGVIVDELDRRSNDERIRRFVKVRRIRRGELGDHPLVFEKKEREPEPGSGITSDLGPEQKYAFEEGEKENRIRLEEGEKENRMRQMELQEARRNMIEKILKRIRKLHDEESDNLRAVASEELNKIDKNVERLNESYTERLIREAGEGEA